MWRGACTATRACRLGSPPQIGLPGLAGCLPMGRAPVDLEAVVDAEAGRDGGRQEVAPVGGPAARHPVLRPEHARSRGMNTCCFMLL